MQIQHANPVGAFLGARQARQQHDMGQQQMQQGQELHGMRQEQHQRQAEQQQQQRQQWLAQNLPEALAYADTPEKWGQSVDYLASLGFTEAEQFRDRFDMRDALLAQVTGNQRNQSAPASVQEYQFYAGLPEDQQQVFMNLQRSGNLVMVGDVPHYRDASGGLVPLSTQAAEAEGRATIAGAVEAEKVRARAGAERDATAPQRMERARQQVAAIDNTFNAIDQVVGEADWNSTGFIGALMRNIPATDAYDLNSIVTTIKANVGFDRLQAMRDASPTGGALGQVAVQELEALQASIAALDTAQSREQLVQNLQAVRRHYEGWRRAVLEAAPQNPTPSPSPTPGGDNDPLGLRGR